MMPKPSPGLVQLLNNVWFNARGVDARLGNLYERALVRWTTLSSSNLSQSSFKTFRESYSCCESI